jgi:Domain of unknown function (DUF5710)
MTSSTRINLKVHYTEKEEAKALGARWDAENRTWYAPPGTDLEHLKRWLPEGVLYKPKEPPKPPQEPQKGIALTELLDRVKQIFDSCAAVFDVSPLAMDRGSRPGRWHSATFHAFLSGLPH